jgi:hypothetical protein
LCLGVSGPVTTGFEIFLKRWFTTCSWACSLGTKWKVNFSKIFLLFLFYFVFYINIYVAGLNHNYFWLLDAEPHYHKHCTKYKKNNTSISGLGQKIGLQRKAVGGEQLWLQKTRFIDQEPNLSIYLWNI